MSTCLPEDNKINLINIQPTTKFVDKKGPSTNPEYYVKKVDFDKKLSTVPTNETVVSISNSLITNALDNYYDKDHIDGQLSCKSNTDHTHTTINNTLTVNNKRLNLYSNNKYTYLVIGKQDANHQSIMFGFGDDDKGQYAYLRVQGGSQLTIFTDNMTFPGELTINTINGINPSNISLNSHNHDNLYAKLDHVHSFNDIEDKPELALAKHSHSYNSLTDIPDTFNPSTHSHSFNDLKDKPELALAKHTHSYNSLTNIPESFSPSEHNHDNLYAKLVHKHTQFDEIIVDKINNITIPFSSDGGIVLYGKDPYYSYVDSQGNCNIGNSITFFDMFDERICIRLKTVVNNHIDPSVELNILDLNNYNFMTLGLDSTSNTVKQAYITLRNSLTFFGENENSLSVRKNDKNLFKIGVLPEDSGEMNGASYISLKRTDSTTDYEWLMGVQNNHDLVFYNYKKQRVGYLWYGATSCPKINTTITHNAPITEKLDNYEIGKPVFMSGKVYKLSEEENQYKYINQTDTIDCISSVKSTGTYKEFLGIIVNKHKSGEQVSVGDVVKKDVIINQDTVDFATHGDYYFRVDDSSKYKIGDTVLYDGSIVDDDVPITNKIIKSTIGSITGIINEHIVSVFKS